MDAFFCHFDFPDISDSILFCDWMNGGLAGIPFSRLQRSAFLRSIAEFQFHDVITPWCPQERLNFGMPRGGRAKLLGVPSPPSRPSQCQDLGVSSEIDIWQHPIIFLNDLGENHDLKPFSFGVWILQFQHWYLDHPTLSLVSLLSRKFLSLDHWFECNDASLRESWPPSTDDQHGI